MLSLLASAIINTAPDFIPQYSPSEQKYLANVDIALNHRNNTFVNSDDRLKIQRGKGYCSLLDQGNSFLKVDLVFAEWINKETGRTKVTDPKGDRYYHELQVYAITTTNAVRFFCPQYWEKFSEYVNSF